jgi:hypothetical protein
MEYFLIYGVNFQLNTNPSQGAVGLYKEVRKKQELVCAIPFSFVKGQNKNELVLTYHQAGVAHHYTFIATEATAKEFIQRLIQDLEDLGIKPEYRRFDAFRNFLKDQIQRAGTYCNTARLCTIRFNKYRGHTKNFIDEFLAHFSEKHRERLYKESCKHYQRYTIA